MMGYVFDGDTPELGELLTVAANKAKASTWVALPAVFTSYDPATNCATVKPVVKAPTPKGQPDTDLPPIPCTPVCHLEAGGFVLRLPVEVGDPCLLIIASVSISQWVKRGNAAEAPESSRRASLSDAIAIPGLRSSASPYAAPGDKLTLGLDAGGCGLTLNASGKVANLDGDTVNLGGGSDFVALASKVQGELTKIATAFASFIPGSGGASFAQPYTSPSQVRSTKVKAT